MLKLGLRPQNSYLAPPPPHPHHSHIPISINTHAFLENDKRVEFFTFSGSWCRLPCSMCKHCLNERICLFAYSNLFTWAYLFAYRLVMYVHVFLKPLTIRIITLMEGKSRQTDRQHKSLFAKSIVYHTRWSFCLHFASDSISTESFSVIRWRVSEK